MNNLNAIQVIKNRRAINFFDPNRDVSIETINELLSVANLTPSSMNLQPWHVVVVKDEDRKKVLRGCAFDQPKVEEASVDLIIIADPAGLEENIEKVIDSWLKLGYIQSDGVESTKGNALGLYGKQDSIARKTFAVKNASFFAMTIMIAAQGMGLNTHPMDGFNEAMIKEEFNIPEDKIIPLIIAVGYKKSDIELLPRAFRRDLADFVKNETFS